jgi:hypothetical protein
MLRRVRRHLTYANVMATIAVFIALGGSSYAALKITGRNVKNNSLTYKDLKRNTLGGTRIKESRLGKVRRARRADRVGGRTAGQLLVRCPRGTFPLSDTCIEALPHTAASYLSAVFTCANIDDNGKTPGRRLPTHNELLTATGAFTLAGGGELTQNVYPSSSSGNGLAVLVVDAVGNTTVVPATGAGAKAFRCVADPLN